MTSPALLSAPGTDAAPLLTVLCRVGTHRLGLDARQVERVFPMAALTSEWPPSPPRCGVLNVAGQVLPVIDARQVLNLAAAEPELNQRLLLLRSPERHLLWVDEVMGLQTGERRGEAVLFESGELWPLLDPESYPLERP